MVEIFSKILQKWYHICCFISICIGVFWSVLPETFGVKSKIVKNSGLHMILNFLSNILMDLKYENSPNSLK